MQGAAVSQRFNRDDLCVCACVCACVRARARASARARVWQAVTSLGALALSLAASVDTAGEPA